VAKGSYLGGGTIIDRGAYSDPSGRGVGGRTGSPPLKGSARMPNGVLARKIPHIRAAIMLLAELCDVQKLRLHNIAEIRKYAAALNSFQRDVTHQHRLAYDNGRRLIEEELPHVRRRMGAKHETLMRRQSLQRLYS
jgi:hypothetical protein